MSDEPLVLGIETSCDETRRRHRPVGTLLVDAIASRPMSTPGFGGVVPEACSGPPSAMVPDHRAGLCGAGVRPEDLGTRSPSPRARAFAGALMVGWPPPLPPWRSASRWRRQPPRRACCRRHRRARRRRSWCSRCSCQVGTRCWVPDVTGMQPLGATIDDAGRGSTRSRVLGLDPSRRDHIDRAARDGGDHHRLPRGLTTGRDLERQPASTSPSPASRPRSPAGSRPNAAPGRTVPVAEVAASFQEAVVDVPTRRRFAPASSTASRTW